MENYEAMLEESKKYNKPTCGTIRGARAETRSFYVWIEDDKKRAEFLEFCLKHKGDEIEIKEDKRRNDILVTLVKEYKRRIRNV